MASISSPGLGSGLDVNSIVSQLMVVERQPETLLTQKEASYQAQLSIMAQIKSGLATFQSAAQGLSSASATAAFGASASDTSVLTASADSTAAAGSHSIAVAQLAQAEQLVAAGQASSTAAIGSGASTTLSFQLGSISGGSFDSVSGTYSGASFTPGSAAAVSVTIDSSNNTLEGIRDAINAANAGVTASIVNDGSGTPYRLVLTGSATGANSSLKIDVSGDATLAALLSQDPAGTQSLSQTAAAQDAKLTVDGIAITSATNAVSGALQGVTLNLAKAGSATLSVARDTSGLSNALTTLVSAYNDVNKTISDATAYQGTLQGDFATLSIQRTLRSAIGTSLSVSGTTLSYLSQLGVTFQKDGSLSFDGSALQSAVGTSQSGVQALIGAFGSSLTTLADNMVASNGAVAARTDGLNSSIASIEAQKAEFEQRMTQVQATYMAQFTALDTLISSMNTTSSFLTQQLASLASLSSSSGSGGK